MAMRKKATRKKAKKTARKATRKVAKKAMKKAPRKVRCSGKTALGKRCKRYASGKSKFCAAHK